MSIPICFLCLWLLLWHRVAVEMQESPSHNFGQLAVEPLESTSRCCVDSFLVVNSPLTPSHQPQLQSQVNWSRLKDGGRRKETSVRQEKGWVGPGWGEGRRQTNHDYLLHKEGKFRLWESDLLIFPQWLPMHCNARTNSLSGTYKARLFAFTNTFHSLWQTCLQYSTISQRLE